MSALISPVLFRIKLVELVALLHDELHRQCGKAVMDLRSRLQLTGTAAELLMGVLLDIICGIYLDSLLRQVVVIGFAVAAIEI